MEGQPKQSVLQENLPSYMIKKLTDKVTPLHEAANRDIRLQDAALEGEVTLLNDLLLEDPHILDRNRYMAQNGCSPLHVSAKAGHLGFVQMILQHKPDLAEELDQSKRWSPLHMASAKGHLEIVNVLLEANPKMCFARDIDGRNAVHISAIYGHTGVLAVLLRAKPQTALELTNAGETVFHLCVKHNRPEALQFLIAFTDNDKLLNSKDSGDNTVLHLAVAAKQHGVVDILLETKMDKNAINRNGFTAKDLCSRSTKEEVDIKIWKSLKRAKASRRKNTVNRHRDWLEKQRNALMVVASLIATMAFQTGVNPPGGVWQEDDNENNYKAGNSIMQDKDSQRLVGGTSSVRSPFASSPVAGSLSISSILRKLETWTLEVQQFVSCCLRSSGLR
uniref:PGG domain-containing protein n=1 Tax=Chenopodium quinoa TaxID=63459 RepID=A0A803NCN3_CHEQI